MTFRQPAKGEVDYYETVDGIEAIRTEIKDLSLWKQLAFYYGVNRYLGVHGSSLCSQVPANGDPLSCINCGNGLFEFRIQVTDEQVSEWAELVRESAKVPIGVVSLRVYFHETEGGGILLLHLYDHGVLPGARRQRQETDVARGRLSEWRNRRPLT